MDCGYRSVPGKHPWAFNHKPSFFTILGACPVYWALTVCENIYMKLILTLYSWMLILMSACYVILAHVTWALFIRAAKTVTWALTQAWALAQDTTVSDTGTIHYMYGHQTPSRQMDY